MSSPIKTVVLAGASGNLGPSILTKLLAAKDFQVKVLRRQGSSASVASGAQVIDVDYTSKSDLVSALAGVDAVVSNLPAEAKDAQTLLIDAAIEAGVRRFLPSDFGSNLDNPVVRGNNFFKGKIQTQEYLKAKAETTGLTYTFVYTAAFLDWGLLKNFLVQFNEPNPMLVGDGNTVFSATELSSIGDGVVGVLRHPEETRNRSVYIDNIKLTQNKILELARQVKPEKTWEPKYISVEDLIETSEARVAQGTFDGQTIFMLLYRSLFDPKAGSSFEKNDNELLGVSAKTEEDVIKWLQKAL